MQHRTSITVGGRRARIVAISVAALAVATPMLAQQKPPTGAAAAAPASTLERIRQAGRMKFGYRTDARPFAYRNESGQAAGYSVALCNQIAEAIRGQLGPAALPVEWVPVTAEDRFQAVQQRKVDLLCGAETQTLARMKQVSFSIPVFPGGIGALLRKDAADRLKEILANQPSTRPNWRAQAGQLLQEQTFAVVKGTTAETWLAGKLSEFKLTAKVTPVTSYEEGVAAVADRKASVFFGDMPILMDAAARSPSADKLQVLERRFTHEPLALAYPRGDEDLRGVVDGTLSQLYRTGAVDAHFRQWFGEPDENTLLYYRWNAVPE